MLTKLADAFCLEQYVDKPTHCLGNSLDLVFVNNSLLIHDYSVLDVLQTTSHHKIVEFSLSLTPQGQRCSRDIGVSKDTVRSSFSLCNFYDDKIDWESLNADLATIC